MVVRYMAWVRSIYDSAIFWQGGTKMWPIFDRGDCHLFYDFSSLLPPRGRLHFFHAYKGLSIPTARWVWSRFANSRSRIPVCIERRKNSQKRALCNTNTLRGSKPSATPSWVTDCPLDCSRRRQAICWSISCRKTCAGGIQCLSTDLMRVRGCLVGVLFFWMMPHNIGVVSV